MYLNAHSYYSLRYGTLSPEELVTRARGAGIRHLALTDIHNSTAMPEFVRLCRREGIHPVAGMEFRRDDRLMYLVLARDNEGFRRINAFMSQYNLSGDPLPAHYPVCQHTYVIYPWRSGSQPESELPAHVFLGISPATLRGHGTPTRRTGALRPARCVALLTVSFASAQDHAVHCYLRAIDHNVVLSRLQPHQMGDPGEVFQSPDALRDLYAAAGDSNGHLLRAAEKLLESCRIDFYEGQSKNKRHFTGDAADDKALLEKLALDGLQYRYGNKNPEARARIRHELEVIDRLGFSSYFLITSDIVRYSMSRGFHHVGRGSGANSIVAYCLRITDVDPIELNLYFERFINPKRSSPPDFDIDYSWRERDQVLEYIFKRYGRLHTALLGTISTFRDRSLLRELGKVMGLPKEEIDQLGGRRPGPGCTESLMQQIEQLSARLQDFPNLRSIHAGGVLIAEHDIRHYSALDLPPKGLPVVQWDMYTAEEIGFEKFDILSQRGIGHIRESVEIIHENRGERIDIHQTEHFKKDAKVRRLLRSGQTTGCFYVESPAMRGLLRKLRCETYLSLVAASSIIRPGVASSGMMRTYIERFHNQQQVAYLHPVMREQLSETFGVMVYQEDVIKVCHHFAGLGLDEADVLRRAMSGKFRSKAEMQRLTDVFFENCRQKGYDEALTREVWRQIESFAGYSFSKAHSASFAVESYQSMYLKAHYPLEFLTAVINNAGGFYRSEVYYNEARRYGGRLECPCVNHSRFGARLAGRQLYIGLAQIAGLEDSFCQRILNEREQEGPYGGWTDFIRRTRALPEQLILLIRAGALRFTGLSKARLMWETRLQQNMRPPPGRVLFESPPEHFDFPCPESEALHDAWDEIELLGFPVSMSPFQMLKTPFRDDVQATDMLSHTGSVKRMLGWLVAVKYVRTKNGKTMLFGCFLDAGGTFFDSVHFPDVAQKYPFRGSGMYLLRGRIAEEFGHPSLEVDKMARLPLQPDSRMA